MIFFKDLADNFDDLAGKFWRLLFNGRCADGTKSGKTLMKFSCLQAPIIYSGPADMDADDFDDPSTWKMGPVQLTWNDTKQLWEAGGGGATGVHHHRDNSSGEGGLAFAYFFR